MTLEVHEKRFLNHNLRNATILPVQLFGVIMTEINTLTQEDYRRLLSFSEGLNPYDMNFRKTAMDDLLHYFPFDGAAFPLVDGKGYYKHLIYVNFTPISIESYERDCYKNDFFAPANLKETKQKSVYTIEDFTSYVEYETSSLYSQCLYFNGFYYEALVLLRDERGKPLGAVAVYHGKSTPGFTLREQLLLEEIGIIMEKAIRLHLNYLSMQNNLNFFSRIFARHPIGMILCDGNFSIQEINQEALHILDQIGLPSNEDGAGLLLKDYILPVFQEGTTHRFCLRLAEGVEVFLENIIAKEHITDSFVTRYAIFLNLSAGNSRTSWVAYLKERELTKRECEVTSLLCQGYKLIEIADLLKISLNTVKRHKESIYSKMKVNSSSQLILLYQEIKNSR